MPPITTRGAWCAGVAMAAVAAALAGGPPPSAQEPTFRAGTLTVPVNVSVTDTIGQFVLDLAREDFELRDDGKVQPITQFTTGVEPITAIVLLDGSRSMVNAIKTVITSADHLVVRMIPGDRARVGSFSEEVRLGPAFTDDRDQLAREVNDLFNLRMGMRTSLWDALGRALDSFETVIGRRVVIVFTDGDDTASILTPAALMRRARSADIMIYAVLIRGMNRLPEDRRGTRRSRPQDLADLALASGGGYYFVNNVLDDMNGIATQIASELHSRYILGFVPQQLDGKVHRLEIRVKRPGVRLRARETYVADPEPGSPR